MTCAECREAFSARVDDALGADARATLEQHLAGCAECRREWQRFAATVDLLHAVQPERAPAPSASSTRAEKASRHSAHVMAGSAPAWP